MDALSGRPVLRSASARRQRGSGTEPRYTCNVYIQDRNDAYTVLRDFAAIFRGMTYWGGDQIVALADMPRDVDYTIPAQTLLTVASPIPAAHENRYTALVSWSDPANAYADAMEPVFEQALVARYGFNQLEMTAIGCTRQSEANRKGAGVFSPTTRIALFRLMSAWTEIFRSLGTSSPWQTSCCRKGYGRRISAVNGRVIKLDRVLMQQQVIALFSTCHPAHHRAEPFRP
jgi:predicted phage tail protein